MSIVSFLPDVVVYGVGGGLFLCICGISCFHFSKRCFSTERRAIIDAKYQMKVEVLIVEKVVEEEKFDPGPPRELTRRELKKQRERERGREKSATAGTVDGGSPSRQAKDTEMDKEGKEGKGTWSSWLKWSGKDAKITGEQTFVAVNSTSGDIQSVAKGDIEEGTPEIGIDDEEKERRRKAEKKARKEEKKRAALATAQEEDTLDKIEKIEKAAADEKAQHEAVTSELKKSSSKHHEAVAKREARRQKIKDEEEKKAAQEMMQKFLDEETPEQRQARHEMERREKMDKEEKRLAALEVQRQNALKDSMLLHFGKRRSTVLTAPSIHRGSPKADPSTISLFDIDPRAKGRQIAEKRLEERMDLKMELVEEGQMDCVTLNSGPPITLIPEGKRVVPLIPELKAEVLQHRRIMIWMEENKSKGWYLGIVSGATKRPGYDFTVKFDKAETASIDIDGIKSCKMTANGEHGYGKAWVLLEDG